MTLDIRKEGTKKYLDAVKGFCIFLVIMQHAELIYPGRRYLTSCYMQVFFVLGGITYKDRCEETFRMFAAKKAKRLLLPYFLYSTVLLLLDAILNFDKAPDVLIRGG